jgi:mannose-6-phosphate isomerase-like protein (cupin superfamily)
MQFLKKSRPSSVLVLLVLFFTCGSIAVLRMAAGQTKPAPQVPLVVDLNMKSDKYQEVLGGPPKSVSMESGLVTLAPSKSGEKHSTKKYEEVLVVFTGTGEMRITGKPALSFKPNTVVYCPPMTEHYVVNTGSEPLKYLYVAAKAQP